MLRFAIGIGAIDEFAHGSADLHAAGNTRRAAAGAKGRAGDRGGGAGLGVVLGLAAAVLWFHYGTAVFFETIAVRPVRLLLIRSIKGIS